MGDVSAAEHNPQFADIAHALEGGDGFAARLSALDKAKRDHQAAYEKFRIGNDARAALDDANRKHEHANQRLAEASQQAEDIVAAAKKKANDILASAHASADFIAKAAEQKRQAADGHYHTIVSEVDRLRHETVQLNQDAKDALKAATTKLRQAEKLKAELHQSRQEHQESCAAHRERVDALAEVLRKIG